MAGVLDALLEGFAAAAPTDPASWAGRFTTGDTVRVPVKGGKSIVGRVVRPHGAMPDTHVVIDPYGSGAHVEAEVASVRLDTPSQHAVAARRAQQEALKRAQAMPGPGQGAPAPVAPAVAKPAPVSEGIALLVEAFAPPTTPAQSTAAGSAQVAAAQASLKAGWSATKHPRAAGGKFGYTTGGKRATRAPATPRTLQQGTKGTLVKSIQRQLGVPATGTYDSATQAAVTRYQRQHGLQIDGVVGRQTLAALRGHTNPAGVKPGPIASKAATVRVKAAKVPKARTVAQLNAAQLNSGGTSQGGGVVVG